MLDLPPPSLENEQISMDAFASIINTLNISPQATSPLAQFQLNMAQFARLPVFDLNSKKQHHD